MRFVSKSKELRLIRKPSDRIMDEQRRPIILRGERYEFFNHKFNTDDEDIIDWLVGHPLYGVEFTSDRLVDKPIPKLDAQTSAIYTDDKLQKEAAIIKRLREEEEARAKYESMKPDPIILSKGPISTVSSMRQRPNGAEENLAPTPDGMVPMTKDEVVQIIDSKITEGFEKVLNLLTGVSSREKPKRVWTCKVPGCNAEPFQSGFSYGKHMKEAHPKE